MLCVLVNKRSPAARPWMHNKGLVVVVGIHTQAALEFQNPKLQSHTLLHVAGNDLEVD